MASTILLNIPLDFKQVMDLVMQLPAAQKKKMLKSLEQDLSEKKKNYIPADQIMVVKERLAVYKKNPSRGKSWETVRAQLDKKYKK